jgi:hypothetical protein
MPSTRISGGSRGKKIRDGSRRARSRTAAGRKTTRRITAEPAPNLFQGGVVSRFRTSQVKLGRSLAIDNFLLTEFRKKRNGHRYLTIGKSIHARSKTVAVGRYISIIASLSKGRSRVAEWDQTRHSGQNSATRWNKLASGWLKPRLSPLTGPASPPKAAADIPRCGWIVAESQARRTGHAAKGSQPYGSGRAKVASF